ncbi:Signal peptide peptidase [Hondaea fermentalgiana]|uniref:Signal peptide peptidase n=1 Tax=Hondaea fermentalgiana TaxID=2315210 RepID=A0A2R5GGJ3_9STRA|nr:Signal peptide peptidase [Hondaea fermentalgiana]|eukprot:GBG27381.1 Signal peptide peptidase [Hondaea fermentalgiana]
MASNDESAEVERAVRPRALRSQLLVLYALLGGVLAFFAGLSLVMTHKVPAGYFEKEDGSLIHVEDFDPVELGPFPKCHPHFGEHLSADGSKWISNSAIEVPEGVDPESIMYPVGHPKNAAWIKRRDAKANESKLSMQALQPSIHLLILSVICVYLASKHSVWLFCRPDANDVEDEENDEDVGQSALQDGDAYLFPVIGSAVLFGLFVIYKYIDSDLIKYLFSCYVVVMCTNGLGINLGQFVALWYNSRGLGQFRTLFRVPYFDVDVTWIDIVAYIISALLGVFYMQTKNWIVNNMMGLSFCLLGIKHIGISSYRTGVIMLLGLFLYDCFWVFGSTSVFGSNVMVTVATGVEAPIKLMFPRGQDGCGNMMFSMLGLGDIVVPGLTIAFLAKYDVSRPAFAASQTYSFLNVTMVAYTLSLITTVLVMLVFNHAQPALLYIVPYILVASFGFALAKGEFSQLNSYVVEDTLIDITGDADAAAAATSKKDD